MFYRFLIFSSLLILVSCKKEGTQSSSVVRLSIDSLVSVSSAAIPYSIYTDMCFPSATTGYAISNNGMIIKTGDGGTTWTALPSPVSSFLRKIQFIDQQTGFILGGDNAGVYVLNTTDAGNNWSVIALNVPGVDNPTGMFFLNRNKGFITGPGFFLETNDGGKSWTPVLPGNTGHFYDVEFVNDQTGMATTERGKFYRTDDGGATWQLYETHSANLLRDIYFAGSETWIRSANKLVNINPARPPVPIPAAISKLHFIDSRSCIGIGQHYDSGFWPYGDIFLTSDTWSGSSVKTFMPESALNFSAIARISERKFIMLGTGHLEVSVVVFRY